MSLSPLCFYGKASQKMAGPNVKQSGVAALDSGLHEVKDKLSALCILRRKGDKASILNSTQVPGQHPSALFEGSTLV